MRVSIVGDIELKSRQVKLLKKGVKPHASRASSDIGDGGRHLEISSGVDGVPRVVSCYFSAMREQAPEIQPLGPRDP